MPCADWAQETCCDRPWTNLFPRRKGTAFPSVRSGIGSVQAPSQGGTARLRGGVSHITVPGQLPAQGIKARPAHKKSPSQQQDEGRKPERVLGLAGEFAPVLAIRGGKASPASHADGVTVLSATWAYA